jgi:hypothetical protein
VVIPPDVPSYAAFNLEFSISSDTVHSRAAPRVERVGRHAAQAAGLVGVGLVAVLEIFAADAVLTSLNGITPATGDPSQREQAGRMLDLLMDGLRYGASG